MLLMCASSFAPPMLRQSLLHALHLEIVTAWATGGNDSTALLAMGYRHMHGLGVPQSCEAAALYYNPVAEAVIEAHRDPRGLAPVGASA